MRLISTALIILCILLIATPTIAKEQESGRFQVATASHDRIFLIDTAIGQVWVLSVEYIGDAQKAKWVPIGFIKGDALPGDNALFVGK